MRSARTGLSSSAASARTGLSSSAASNALTCSSGRSIVSVLSLTRNAPSVKMKQPCDLEALKDRYVESIRSAARDAKTIEGDHRLDCDDERMVVNTLGVGDRPNLGVAMFALAVAALCAAIALVVAYRGLFECHARVLVEAFAAWLLALLGLDFAAVSFLASMRWCVIRSQLAERRDQRWMRVEHRRAQKDAAMRSEGVRTETDDA